ncbi:isoprenyl transferase [bacterium]|nr:isoprenyl transferase [bacterium]MBQ4438399.1 isoprenyl transferase [bacterium]
MNEYCIKYGLNEERLPQHVAIIMDGNGRWAKKRLWNRIKGHRAGADAVDAVTTLCREIGVKYLTLYAFSTENWNRPESEVTGLMELFKEFLISKKHLLIEKSIRLNIIGSKDRFSPELLKLMNDTIAETEKYDPEMTLTLALSYGSRQEITQAVRKIAQKVAAHEITPESIDEKLISESLYTFDMPDPDLVIRTSGEYRISNYLLWQIAYSEFYFTDTLWPDFNKDELVKALKDYAGRERRFGKTGDQIRK